MRHGFVDKIQFFSVTQPQLQKDLYTKLICSLYTIVYIYNNGWDAVGEIMFLWGHGGEVVFWKNLLMT